MQVPYFGIGLHVIVAIFFAVHAVRTHQNMYWLLLLFIFPGLGSIVYFFAIYLPSLRQTRGARAAGRAIKQIVDPGRAVREAREAFDRAPTVDHRMRLGAALLDAGQAPEALQHYEAAASGPSPAIPRCCRAWRRRRSPTASMPRRVPPSKNCMPPTRRHASRRIRPCSMPRRSRPPARKVRAPLSSEH